jgi:arginyl-tRNA synthetase
MNLDSILRSEIQKALVALFDQSLDQFQLQPTNQEFEGSHTLVCFPLTKLSKKGPEETARLIGDGFKLFNPFIQILNTDNLLSMEKR